jgi:membrane protein YqaA with SNARE-associated domain
MSDDPRSHDRRRSRPLARFERWLETAVHRPGAFWWLVAATAIENTVVPLTVEPIVVPLMALYRDRVVPFAAAMWLGSIVGGIAMYGLGLGLAAGVAPWWADPTAAEAAAGFVERLEGEGFWAIFVFAISPLPYQAATLGAGVAGYPFAMFVVAITFGRGLLYAGFAVAVRVLGSALHDAMARYKVTVLVGGSVVAIVVMLALGFTR